MRSKLRGQRGMSLVEATIILSVLALLTSVLAPSIMDFVNDAKDEKVKEDVEEIGIAIYRVVRDTGIPCLLTVAGGCVKAGRVDLLLSDGNNPTLAASATAYTPENTGAVTDATLNWLATSGTAATQQSIMETQFVTNNGGIYTGVAANFSKSGPSLGLGWRGAYVASPIGPDPWGNKYEANTVFVGVATDATGALSNGEGVKGWSHDVIVLSAGRNGAIESPFGGTANFGTSRTGDDVVYVLSGSTR